MAGSLTKSFTALAVLKLIEQGKIDPNANIKNYIPDFSIRTLYEGEAPITVNHLLTHTSGLMVDYYVHSTDGKKYSNADLLSQLQKEYLCFKPGSACKYSNIGYRLLGMMIEQVTEERSESYLEKEVFKPLGLNYSSFDYTVDMALHMSKGHNGDTEMSRVDNEDKSASGLFSTLHDLTAFLKFLSSRTNQLRGGINNNAFEVSLTPDLTGHTEKRFVREISGDKLVLETIPHVLKGEKVTGVWIYQRVK